jgi:hypothetical protein
MTLDDAKMEFLNNPKKRIIRAGNSGFRYISVWFTVNLVTGCLMCATWEVRLDGMELIIRRAAFQESEYTDWVLID